jgi:hypothetical protein
LQIREVFLKFTAKHHRAFEGNDISMTARADAKETMNIVRVTLDDAVLEETRLAAGTQSFEADYPRAGEAGPGRSHVLIITVWEQDGTMHSSTTEWADTN